MRPTVRRSIACTLASATLALFSPVASQAAPSCTDPSRPLRVEEQRLSQPVPQELLARSGFADIAPAFAAALCEVGDLAAAERLIGSSGDQVWERAVARSQGRETAGDLPAADDRPLYWARLGMTAALRQWTPSFPLDDAQREQLLWSLEQHSRGQTSVQFPRGAGIKRVLVSGFDPFQLNGDIRRSNPSGAAALALDGLVLNTASGPVRVETAMFPVLWKPFERGMVEQTFLPHLRPGRDQVDLFATVSQGRPEQFDVEQWNGRWHTGVDNDDEQRDGVAEIPPGVPTVEPAPEFVPSTQPYAAIVNADTGRYPVFHNTEVTEIPAGATEPVVRPDGPTPGSAARAGGGGSYLSNEIAYRTTLLRDAVGADLRGGHVHTPVLTFAPDNAEDVVDPVFTRNLQDIIAQVRAIVEVAATAEDGEPAVTVAKTPRDRIGRVPAPTM
ncbi:pyroglutamyl peptidase [Saccharopolyspora indica]|uniref:pyroglutamyl peptidase n=1 Tax=Saccharopolyspora indica TaxID=1229659 RepID=UPI0022EAA598|nr:pyroglutamyl peptidase [Saccharopolyspora indica]MDA3645723.1 pyroglutamyl peptidase [Saccharopolyspora indica]